MTSTTPYAGLHRALSSIAVNCDGARERDGMGFDGTDTKFGRRAASISADDWTIDIAAEVAGILPKYRRQVSAAGIDLDAVLAEARPHLEGEKRGDGRRQAWAAEKAAEAKTKRSVVQRGDNAYFTLDYNDEANQHLWHQMGGQWDSATRTRYVRCTAEVIAQAQAWGCKGAEMLVPAGAPAAKVNVTLDGKCLRWDFPFSYAVKDAVKALPGSRFEGASKVWTTSICFEALATAQAHGLVLSAEAVKACGQAKTDTVNGKDALLPLVSRMADPADLPEAFIALLPQAVLA